MQIPSIPTDNLHKFRAITGLWLIGLGIVLPWVAFLQITQLAQPTWREASQLKVDLEHFGRELKEIEAKQKADPKSVDLAVEREIRGRLAEVARKSAVVEVEFNRVNELLNFTRIAVLIGAVGALFGVRLARRGFSGWSRIQSAVDATIERDANLARREGDTTALSSVASPGEAQHATTTTSPSSLPQGQISGTTGTEQTS